MFIIVGWMQKENMQLALILLKVFQFHVNYLDPFDVTCVVSVSSTPINTLVLCQWHVIILSYICALLFFSFLFFLFFFFFFCQCQSVSVLRLNLNM